MRTKIQKWGNSLALRIPRPFAEETGLGQNSEVEVSLEEGRLVILPLKPTPLSLDELLAQVTDDNLHAEIDTGERVGSEIW
jgi:antitoxin MazE